MRVLLIEDNQYLREEICNYLTRRRHDVIACATLAEGRAASLGPNRASGIEAIVCDVNLPDGNGVQFCAETAAALPNRRWVLMSGGHQPEEVARLQGIAANMAIVEKPLRIKDLASLVVVGSG